MKMKPEGGKRLYSRESLEWQYYILMFFLVPILLAIIGFLKLFELIKELIRKLKTKVL